MTILIGTENDEGIRAVIKTNEAAGYKVFSNKDIRGRVLYFVEVLNEPAVYRAPSISAH